METGIYSVSAPSVFYNPQKQIRGSYIARYYLKKYHVRLGSQKFMLTKLVGGQSRIDQETELLSL